MADDTSAGGFAITLVFLILFIVISTVLSYWSFRGMLTWGIGADTFWPYFGKSLANSLLFGLPGIVLYVMSEDADPYRLAARTVKDRKRQNLESKRKNFKI